MGRTPRKGRGGRKGREGHKGVQRDFGVAVVAFILFFPFLFGPFLEGGFGDPDDGPSIYKERQAQNLPWKPLEDGR